MKTLADLIRTFPDSMIEVHNGKINLDNLSLKDCIRFTINKLLAENLIEEVVKVNLSNFIVIYKDLNKLVDFFGENFKEATIKLFPPSKKAKIKIDRWDFVQYYQEKEFKK